jgi:PAS domain S-box-containing protein
VQIVEQLQGDDSDAGDLATGLRGGEPPLATAVGILVQDQQGETLTILGVSMGGTGYEEGGGPADKPEIDYRGLFENAHDAILILDPEEETVLDANPRACEMYGFSQSEFVGMSLRAISRDVRRGQSLILETLEKGSHRFETVQFRKDGTELPLEVNASVLDYKGKRAILSINRDLTERQRLQERLEAQAASQALLLDQLLTAQEAERRRLAIDIHDGPLQSLGVSLLAVDRVIRRYERGEHRLVERELRSFRRSLVGAVEEVRAVLADLSMEILTTYGLGPALESYVKRFSEVRGVSVSLLNSVRRRLPADIELLMYRLAQEAFSNIRKHSEARSATVSMEIKNGVLYLTISDDGRGFDVNEVLRRQEKGGGLGLRSMRHRVQAAGGDLHITSSPGKGTTLGFWCPLPRGGKANTQTT